MPEPASDVTLLLNALAQGDARAADRLFPLVYDELRRLAAAVLRREPPGTLQPTALVHEAYLRLVRDDGLRWSDRAYFFGTAARAMRRIVIERAKRARRPKHGGKRARLSLDAVDLLAADGPVDWPAVEDELLALERLDSRAHQVLMLRMFAGLGVAETADLLSLSHATIKRESAYALAWLNDRLEGTDQANVP